MPPAAPGPAAAVLAPTAPWPGAPEPAVTAWLSGEPLRWPRWGFGDAWIALAGALVLPILASVPLLIVGGSSSLSNSMIMVWIAVGLITLFCRIATKKMTMVPAGLQNFAEWAIESLYDFLAGLLGEHLVKKTFWFFSARSFSSS